MRDTRIILSATALQHNLQQVRRVAPSSQVLSMVKADAYGHGLDFAVRALADTDAFGVAFLAEAEQVRALTGKPIVIMEGAFSLTEWQRAAEIKAQCVIHQPCQIDWALQHVVSDATIWLKLNAGMNRLGLTPAQTLDAAQRLRAVGYRLILTMHYANADQPEHPLNAEQTAVFNQLAQQLAPIQTSVCNSAALLAWPALHGDWVRPGIMLYGSSPFCHQSAAQLQLKAVMSVESILMAQHALAIGAAVGYGSRWTAQRPSRIGVVAIGYGDGYPRTAHGDLAVVKVVDQLVPVIGRVSMDMLLVDLTDLTYAVPNGTSVCLWGVSPSVDQIAEAAGTLGYELLCRMTQRPIRHHIA